MSSYPLSFPASFKREMGVDPSLFFSSITRDYQKHFSKTFSSVEPVERPQPNCCILKCEGIVLHIQVTALPPRKIALITINRITVNFNFKQGDAEQRSKFMHLFDLMTRRGGG